MAHAKMEPELPDNVVKKKPPPPRPPLPYDKHITDKKSLVSSLSIPSNRMPRRPVLSSKVGGSTLNLNKSEEEGSRIMTTAAGHLSDTRQRSKSSTSLLFSKDDLERQISSMRNTKNKPTPRTFPSKQSQHQSSDTQRPVSAGGEQQTTGRYLSSSLSVSSNASSSSSPLSAATQSHRKSSAPVIQSAPSTPLPERPAPFKSQHKLSSPSSPKLDKPAPFKSQKQSPSSPQPPLFHSAKTHKSVHPEGGKNYTKALQMASSRSKNVLHAPMVKVDLTSKSKYTPRPAPPKPLTSMGSSQTELNTDNIYDVPHGMVPSTDNGSAITIEPYATSQVTNRSRLDSSDAYVQMSSTDFVSNHTTKPSDEDGEDDAYVNSDLGPSADEADNSYTQLTFEGGQTVSIDNVYTDVRSHQEEDVYTDVQKHQEDNLYADVQNHQEDNVYADVQSHQKDNVYVNVQSHHEDNFYSVPSATRNHTFLNSGDQQSQDGYVALSLKRNEDSVYQDLDTSTRTR